MPHASRADRLHYLAALRRRDPPADWDPSCMEPDEYAGWREMNGKLIGSGRALRPCQDCPLGFALDMRAEDRCNGEPGGS